MVPGRPVAFRGSAAVAAGLTTWTVLQGPPFLRLFPDTRWRIYRYTKFEILRRPGLVVAQLSRALP